MLQLRDSIINHDVLSLRTGGKVATIVQEIINPTNLKIEGFYCQDAFSKSNLILLSQDIRESIKQGFIVNDHEVLTESGELVRLKETLETNFTLIGKPVVTVNKEKVGKVTDYAVEIDSMYVQKLYVSQSLFKSLGSGSLSVDRSQIVEITNRKIVIQELLRPEKASLATAPSY